MAAGVVHLSSPVIETSSDCYRGPLYRESPTDEVLMHPDFPFSRTCGLAAVLTAADGNPLSPAAAPRSSCCAAPVSPSDDLRLKCVGSAHGGGHVTV